MKDKIIYGLLGAVLLLQIILVSLFLTQQKSAKSLNQPNTLKGELLTSQNASIRGKILKVDGKKMTVENDHKVQGDVEVGRIVLLNENTKNGQEISVASTSAQISNIKTQKDATINLSLINGKYVVTSVTYR